MIDYNWSRKQPFERLFSRVSTGIGLIGVLNFFLCMNANHLVTWSDFAGSGFWPIIRFFLIMALFPAILWSGMYAFKASKVSKIDMGKKQNFYGDWASVYTGLGKGGHVSFFAEKIESVRMQQTVFEEQPLFTVAIRFKSCGLGRQRDVTFAIRAQSENELAPLENWMRRKGIVPSWDEPKQLYRRS